MHSCKCKCMHKNLWVHLHVHATLEWLLQLQRMGVYLVDSAEGPSGPRRWQAGKDRSNVAASTTSTVRALGSSIWDMTAKGTCLCSWKGHRLCWAVMCESTVQWFKKKRKERKRNQNTHLFDSHMICECNIKKVNSLQTCQFKTI